MDSAQVWTVVGALAALIAAFSAVMFAALGMFGRSLRSEFDARFDAVDARLDAMDKKLDTKADTAVMEARFGDLDHRLGSIETDMHLVKAHLIGQRSA